MNIIEATRAMKLGKKMKRKSIDDNFYCFINSADLICESQFGKIDDEFQMSAESILADDWEVVEAKSEMQKAWEELIPTGVVSNYDYFVYGWNQAQKHLIKHT